ncbi:hypothetical protein C4559_02415 [Candidatus Microgenomates bacterium]|nr:MAG: hypothetical protein C4559_02415 [Candidatus Microgenomates bacterium]
MKKNYFYAVLGIFVGLFLGWLVFQSLPQTKAQMVPQNTKTISTKELNFRQDMRKLWEEHVAWTRMYIESIAFDNPNADSNLSRLLKNQDDIGSAIKPYYGDDAGNKLTGLLKEHINTAAALVSAAKSNDQTALTTANDRWYKNANDIADFLSNANPNIQNSQMRTEMKNHLDILKQESTDILNGNYDAGVTDYDNAHNQILKMSDMISTAIIKQFPNKF